MKISLATEGLFDPNELAAWTRARQKEIRAGVAKGMAAGGKTVAALAQNQMRSSLAVKRQSFVKSLRARVFDTKPEQLPDLLIGSRVPWLGIFERGGRITGNLLIPLLPQRIGPKRFRTVIDGLLRSGNAFFRRVNGKTILFAENITENASQLRRFKRAERSRTGAKRLKRGQEIPIAVLVKSVSLKKRLDLEGTVRGNLSLIADAISQELAK